MTYYPDDPVKEVQRLLDNGASQKKVADATGVAERTLRYWKQKGIVHSPSREEREKAKADRTEATPEPPPWPPERLWPDWTPGQLKELVDWPKEVAEANIALVQMAQEQRNVHLPWFYRRMVDIGHAYGVKYGVRRPEDEWLWAIVGLPVLADWLDAPECLDLTRLVEEYKPWEGKVQRKAFEKAATAIAERIKQRALVTVGRLTLSLNMRRRPLPESPKALSQSDVAVPLLVQALVARTPMLDKARWPFNPIMAPFRRFGLGALFQQIFTYPKGGAM